MQLRIGVAIMVVLFIIASFARLFFSCSRLLGFVLGERYPRRSFVFGAMCGNVAGLLEPARMMLSWYRLIGFGQPFSMDLLFRGWVRKCLKVAQKGCTGVNLVATSRMELHKLSFC